MAETGILVYVPDSQGFIDQFWGLHHSVVHNKDNRHKFKFVVMCKPSTVEKLPQQNCVFFLRDEELADVPSENFKYLFNQKPYKFINSFHHFHDEEVISFMRQNFFYLLRLDVDTFVTPTAYALGCENNEIKVGNGGYSTEDVLERLEAHATKLEIPFRKDVHAIGSTWFGHTEDVIKLGQETVKYVRYLINEDGLFKVCEGKWPDWFAGVILLYGGHLATAASDYKITKFPFDVGTTTTEGLTEAYTLHCWHSDDYFSKFMMTMGKYDDRRFSKKDYERTGNINDYAMFCATTGKLRRQVQYLFPGESLTGENAYILEKIQDLST